MADAWTSKLDAFLDGELSPDEMSALDAHVRTCPACAADVLGRTQLKRAVQQSGRLYSPSTELRQRVHQIVGTRQRAVWHWQVAALATVVLIFAVAFLIQSRRDHRALPQIDSEIADLHVAALASSNPVDVVSSDRHTVKPWFEGKIPFTFNLPELRDSDFTLVGGRVTYLRQTPGAHLIFQLRKHRLSVLIFQDRAEFRALPSDARPRQQAAFNVESWTQGGLRYFVIGDTTADDIHRLADLLRGSESS